MSLNCFQGQEALCLAICHYDAISHYDDVVRLLLSHGANANSRDNQVSGFTCHVSMPFWQALAARAHLYLCQMTLLLDVHSPLSIGRVAVRYTHEVYTIDGYLLVHPVVRRAACTQVVVVCIA